jgi:PAS domain S-box-containing protein
MRTSFQILVVGDVPEAFALPEREQHFDLSIDQVMSGEELDEALANRDHALSITAALLPDGSRGSQVVRKLKSHSPYRPVVMVVDPHQADELVESCKLGLDEYLVRCENLESSAALLARSVYRCLESLTPSASSTGSRFDVALRRATFESVRESLVLLDRRGRIIYFNRAAADLIRDMLHAEAEVGERLDELYGEHLDEHYRVRLERHFKKALRGEEVLIREDLPADEESRFVREYRYAPVINRGGRTIAVSVTSRDLHEMRAVEEKLEQSESRFWQFFQNLPVGIGIIDREGEWVQVNPVLEEILGYTSEELIGTSPLDYIHPDDIERSKQDIAAVVSGEARVLKHQKRMIHRDGHDIWTDVTAMAIGGDGDTPAQHFIGIISDITLRKQLEDQLQDTEKMRMIGQLAGGVAHDFNNLLTIITSYTHYVLGELGDDAPQAAALNKVIQAAHRGSSLTDQLLAFSRRQLSRPKTLDLNAIVDDTREMLDRLLRPLVELNLDLSDDEVPIWIDRAQLEQVLFNLVMNARDAMPEGGELVIRTHSKELRRSRDTSIESIPGGAWGILEVCDTGHGIEPDIIEHIFEPFFTTKEVGSGTGLALASTWGIVKQADAYIDVTSTVGEGTTFTLYFPRSSEPLEEESVAHASAAQPMKSSATVLLVEDDVEVREALRRFLDRRGFRVLEASTGTEALECAHDYTDIIDVLLTDVIMPGMGGKELAETISDERPETHIFLMTGYAGGRFRNLDERWELMPKPLDLDDLAGKLDEALR